MELSWAVFTEVVTCGGLADLTTKQTKRFDLFLRAPQFSPLLTAGRADLVKWGFEDFESKLDIMQLRLS